MKELAKEFAESGWSHKQIMREGDVAMYRRWRTGKEGFAAEEHYEVVKIRVQPAYERFGQSYPDTEHYPSSEMWGDKGWTSLSREKADIKFNQVAHSEVRSSRRNRF